MTALEQYKVRIQKQLIQLNEINLRADQQGRAWSVDFEREEQYLKNKHRMGNVMWFKGLSKEDQIVVAAETRNLDFVKKLDEVQLAAYRIML